MHVMLRQRMLPYRAIVALAVTSACAAPADMPFAEASSINASEELVDDGTYLRRIDPLGGQWKVERIAGQDFTQFASWINFSAGGFLNHGAGCSGGYPAFYRLQGERITLTRIEPVRTGKCSSAASSRRSAAIESERQLAAFLDRSETWTRPDDRTLIIKASDGTRAVLTRPSEPHPELAGRWLIETIAGKRLETERRPPTLSISMNSIGVHADCNGAGGTFTIPAPGRIKVNGPFVSTAIGCLPEDAAEDALMMRAATSATSYRLDGEVLTLTGGLGMIARRPPPPNRRLVGEYEHCGNTLLGAYHEGPITLVIDSRTMRDNAQCTANYSGKGPELAVGAPAGPTCTPSAPPFVPGKPVGIGGKISLLAEAAPDAFAFNELGQLVLRTSRGLLTMCRKGKPAPFGQ